jgi:hypothetical protein
VIGEAAGSEIGSFFIHYWRMARNTGGWREILADGEKYWRMAENTCGWQKILSDNKIHSRMAKITLRYIEKRYNVRRLFSRRGRRFVI